MNRKFNLYLGKAGQLAVMGEFLLRGWNVAMPEVDIGDDIFVVRDEDGRLKRIQVKTALAKERKEGMSAQFNIGVNQLLNFNQSLYYVFMVRLRKGWHQPLIIRQDYLSTYFSTHSIGSVHLGALVLYFSFARTKITCSGIDISHFENDYSDFPQVAS